MRGFPKKERQRIINEYLHNSGRNIFIPHEFVDWLAINPDHEVYKLYFGFDDAHHAREHRINMARQMASGLRIVVNIQEPETQVVSIKVREYPAFISPVSMRRDGGGYIKFDPDSDASQKELRRQAASQLASWLSRYRGCVENFGLDVRPLEGIVESLRESVVDKDAS